MIISPNTFAAICRLNALSVVGRCRTLDAAGDGYGRAEGFTVALLTNNESMFDLPVIANIEGTFVNQDGRSSSLTSPNGEAQTALIKASLSDAFVSPENIATVSLHGTGTPLGDPIEFHSLENIYGDLPRDSSISLMSSKACLGHMEGNAGLAGMLCALGSATQRQRAPIMHLRNLNPYISELISMKKSSHRIALPREKQVAILKMAQASTTSSFGMSGVNSHTVLSTNGDSGSDISPKYKMVGKMIHV